MLHLRRGLAGIDASLRRDGWAKARPLADTGAELGVGVCGIVGVGAVGTRVAAVGAALGMDVTHLYGLTETFGPAVICEWRGEWNGGGAHGTAGLYYGR